MCEASPEPARGSVVALTAFAHDGQNQNREILKSDIGHFQSAIYGRISQPGQKSRECRASKF
jgi:hypothetical protein